MKNLGKLLLLIYLIPLSLYASALASVRASVDSSKVERGEMVTYRIMLSGDNIVRPNILTLCGQDVISTGSQTSIQMINGDTTKSYILTYKFLPQESCIINQIEVDIDSKILLTNTVEINVSAVKIKKDSPFVLTLSTNKKEVFVGEPFEMTLLFKQHSDSQAIDSEFIAPNFQGFWIKEETKSKRYKKDGYTITEKNYKLAGQRIGELKISPAQMRIAFRSHTRDPWAGMISRIKWKSYYSNELNIGVKSIPNGLSLVGDFSISAEIDKDSIKANEAVNVSIKVIGDGNLEDIISFKPNVNGVNVFDEKISIVDGVLTQKMAFVSDRDFEIPSFTLKYYDPVTNESKEVKTKPFSVKITNPKPKSKKLKIKRENSDKSENTETSYKSDFTTLNVSLIFLLGLVIGIVIAKIKGFNKSTKSKKLDLKDEKILLMKLLEYKDDAKVQEVLDILESNIYMGTKTVIDKKLLKELIMKYKIS